MRDKQKQNQKKYDSLQMKQRMKINERRRNKRQIYKK